MWEVGVRASDGSLMVLPARTHLSDLAPGGPKPAGDCCHHARRNKCGARASRTDVIVVQ